MPERNATAQAISQSFNPLGAWDVYLQDQTTSPVENWLVAFVETVTIQANVALDSNTFILNAGAAATITGGTGYYLSIWYCDDPEEPITGCKFYEAEIITITDNVTSVTVECDTPIDFALDTVYVEKTEIGDANAARASATATTTSRVKMLTSPPGTQQWDLTRIMVTGIMDGAPADDLFFDVPALTWGIYFGKESDTTGVRKYLANVKANSDFRASAYDLQYTDRANPLTSYGLSVRKTFAGQDKYGVTIRLEYNTDLFAVYLQEDTSTITDYRFKIMGHVVD